MVKTRYGQHCHRQTVGTLRAAQERYHCLDTLRRVFTHFDPHATEAKQWGAIHPERFNGGLASRDETKDCGGLSTPGKVLFPSLLLRME